jgi:hypothetical protein
VVRSIPVGIAYAIWSGLGIVLISVAALVIYGQKLDMPAMLGMAMIVGGVVVIQVFSNTAGHETRRIYVGRACPMTIGLPDRGQAAHDQHRRTACIPHLSSFRGARMPSAISTDVLIVGAGVAGLWLNARLRKQGYSTVLVERQLGGEQTIKSQGIIHGGTKYALHGALTGASEAIADMPRRWREALAGELDLTGTRLLSDAHYLWSPGTLAGNLTSFFASKAVRGRVDQVKGEQLPPALQDRAFKGKVYRLANW